MACSKASSLHCTSVASSTVAVSRAQCATTTSPMRTVPRSSAAPAPVTLRSGFAGRVYTLTRSRAAAVRSRGAVKVSAGLCPEITEATFEAEVLQASTPVLVDFWAEWCGPCKLVAMTMEALQKEYGDKLKVVKVECDPNPSLVEKYGVYGLPTFIIFKDGEMVPGSQKEGAIGKAKLIKYLEQYGVTN